MKIPTLSALFALVLAVSIMPATAGCSVSLVSNLPENAASVAVDKTTWLAQSFAIPSAAGITSYGLADIQVALQKVGTGALSTYSFRIYSDNTSVLPNVPGKAIGLLSAVGFSYPGFLSSNAAFTFVLSAGPRIYLTPGKTYWIVCTSTNVSTANYLGWNTSSNASSGPGSFGSTVMTSADKGLTWSAAATGNPMALGVDLLTR